MVKMDKLEIVKEAEKKGFDKERWSEIHFNAIGSQTLVQTWLRDNFKIIVWALPIGRDTHDFVVWNYKLFDHTAAKHDLIEGRCSCGYEAALNLGLEHALKLI